MNEVEVKFLHVDAKKMAARLIQLGAKKTYEGKIEPSFFDFPDKRLRKQKLLLRLRRKENKVELTLKEKRQNRQAKIAEETEIVVDDFENMKKILMLIGLKERKSLAKRRVSYVLKDAHYEFDTYKGVPTFLEVEAKSLPALKKAVEIIGLKMKDSKAWSGRELLEHYGRV